MALRRERLETPDGDELVLDHLDGPAASPIVLLLHGLEGSSSSVYIQGILRLVAQRGWRATVLNFRSCARDPLVPRRMLPNQRPRLYHSGETTDLDCVLRALVSREPGILIFAFGASVGGNVLLKWLGEHPEETIVRAAVTISVPYDLAASARHLERGIGPMYVNVFLRTLKAKVVDIASRFPEIAGVVDLRQAAAGRTFHQFDDAATAPLHGFEGADDYYERSSSIRFLDRITVPTLALNAIDDPFLPRDVLRRAREAASPSIRFVTPANGGHVGFISGWLPWRCRYWAEEEALEWFCLRNAIQ
ncbi:MAG TPA: alpha/beta fold hydrolase [Thermoanaerobaculia bacterium]|nr:alpha/beta fold hydrolase [Thermoanaerobaculia bacterium]